MQNKKATVRIVVATLIVLGVIGYLAYTGVEANKSYYVTIQELEGMGHQAYTRHLRVAGTVEPGSIQRDGSHLQFVLLQKGQKLTVNYTGGDAPPDTFKGDAMALADGMYGHDGVFHATQIQAKCASKYAAAPVKSTAAAPSKQTESVASTAR
jgi:cytochrome c-type biogenesis protein CcmE